MKVTKEKAAANREALVRTAGRLFRERGIDGVGVAEICKEAGLTHGALYAQFSSKEALAAEALASGLKHACGLLAATADGHPPNLSEYLDSYLSFNHRDNLAMSCPIAASASEIARQNEVVSARFTEGFEQLVEALEASLGDSAVEVDRHQRALTMIAAMVGGIAVSRATSKADPKLADAILLAVRRIVGELGGETLMLSRRGKRRGRPGG